VGKGKWDGEQMGGGGEVSLQPTRDLSGQASHHVAKEGFQVSRREYRNRGGIFQAKGNYQGDCAMYLRYNANLVHIVPIVCMSC
jgi:hypothetical protein